MDFIKVNEYIEELRMTNHNWEEVRDLCNYKFDKNFSSSKWRKPYDAYIATKQHMITNADEMLEKEHQKLVRAKKRLDIAKKVNSIEKSIRTKEEKGLAITSIFNNQVLEAIKEKSVKVTRLPKGKKTEQDKNNYIFAFGDMHHKGYKKYLNYLMNEMATIIGEKKDKLGFKKISLFELGDSIDGMLRASALKNVKSGSVTQAIEVANAYVELINHLTIEEELEVDFVMINSSNHSENRPLGVGRSELPEEDMARVIVEFVTLGTKENKRVKVITDDIIVYKQNGINYCLSHGHNMTKDKKAYFIKLQNEKGVDIDTLVSGHTHSPEYFDISANPNSYRNKSVITVGHSNVLPDEYAERLLLSSHPSMTFIIDNKNGREHYETIVYDKTLKFVEKELKKENNEKLQIKRLTK